MSFKKVVKDIKDLKIQGAQNVANQAVKALAEFSKKSKTTNSTKFIAELSNAKKVLSAGSDYLIVGRTILNSKQPFKIAKELSLQTL